jgi:hypothetical protein
MTESDNERGNRGYLWFALALLAVLLGSSAQVALRGYAGSTEGREHTASLSAEPSKQPRPESE